MPKCNQRMCLPDTLGSWSSGKGSTSQLLGQPRTRPWPTDAAGCRSGLLREGAVVDGTTECMYQETSVNGREEVDEMLGMGYTTREDEWWPW